VFEAAAAQAAPQVAALLRAMPGFLAMVDASYSQHERDLDLRGRSLQLSSTELNDANNTLRTRAEGQARALESLRATARSLVGEGDDLSASLSASTGDSIEALTDLIRGLTEERRVREAALKESEARANRLALVASRTRNAVLITDAAGRVEWVNQAFADLTGLDCEEVVGKVPGPLLQGPDTDRAEVARIGRLVREGCSFQSEIVNYAKDGRRYWVSIDAQALHDAQGRLTNFIAIEADITARRDAEQALIDAKHAAEEASRAKSEFLANMSHEIRTPMNGVLGMTELLLDTALDPGQLRYAKNIRNSADALLGIINDILDFSKIEAGKMTLDADDFDVREMAEEVAEMSSARACAKGLELMCRVDEAVPALVRGDAGRLRQVLTNLVGNAVKFTAEGEVLIEVALAPGAPEEGTRLAFAVTDTGIGIAPEARERLFTAFTQADGSTTRRFGGTGLGLAISRQLVTLMGGAIDVQSEPGRGSRFHFTVRLDAALAPAAPRTVRGDLRGLSVLIIEDNPTNSDILRHHATHWGMRVALADNALTALAEVARSAEEGRPFDLALVDGKLPGMSGIELARAIRASQGASAPRLVLLTSLTAADVAAAAREAGFDAHLSKPLRREELYRAIERVVGITDPAIEPAPCGTGAQLPRLCGRVLLVEDNRVNQDIGRAMLGAMGLEVEVAGNGRLGVEMSGCGNFDLLLMDCQMPEMDGFTATAAIRQRERAGGRERVPIVALTANAMQGDRERCLAAGMDDYLPKPFTRTQLFAAVARHLGAPRVEAGSPDAPRHTTDQGSEAATPASVPARVLNPGALRSVLEAVPGVGGSFIEDMVNCYLTETRTLVAAMREAAIGGDDAAIGRAAHALKSSSGSVGAEVLAGLGRDIERAVRTGSRRPGVADVAAVEAALADVQPLLEGMIERTVV
jgi:PAS domain S-box-containing protein